MIEIITHSVSRITNLESNSSYQVGEFENKHDAFLSCVKTYIEQHGFYRSMRVEVGSKITIYFDSKPSYQITQRVVKVQNGVTVFELDQ